MKPKQFYKDVMQPEIEDLFERIFEAVSQNHEAKKIYNGWQVWFSNIIENPDILFIGINPNHVKSDPDFEPHENLDYISDKNKWNLKDSTVEIFSDPEIANYFDLSKCVKTNYYYMGTGMGKSLDDLRGILEKESNGKLLVDEFNHKSKEWTRQIIDILKPKYIFCEGVNAFDKVTEYVFNQKIERDKKKDVVVYKDPSTAIIIVGYKRIPKSSISNPVLLIDTIKDLIRTSS